MSKWKKIGTYIQEAMGVPARFGLSNSEKMKLAKDFDKLASDRTTSPNEKIYYKNTAKYFMDNMPDKAFNDMMGGAPEHIGGTIGRRTSAIIGKDKAKKVTGYKEEVEIQEQFSAGMIDKLRKAYGPMKGKKIVPGPLMKTFDKIDKNKDALIQLYKADIPFVSQMAVSRLISKHKMKGEEINKLREDAPTNNASSGAVDMNPTGMSLKKKKELDARTKEYKIHAEKLMAQREKRKLNAKKNICGSFRKNVKENTDNFVREEFIEEDNIATLKNIVKRKQAMPLKFKDGTMKIDLTTASGLVTNILGGKMKPETLKKIMTIINQGKKSQFLQLVDMMYK